MKLKKIVTIPLIIVTITDSNNLELSNVEYNLTRDLYHYTECVCLGSIVLVMVTARQNTHKFWTVTPFLICITQKGRMNYLHSLWVLKDVQLMALYYIELVFLPLCTFHAVLFLLHRQENEVCKCSDLYGKEPNPTLHANLFSSPKSPYCH
jgi:hypothetical protein